MDKSWIDLHDRRSKEYTDGVERFLQLAFGNKDSSNDEIYCPCSTCVNRYCHKLPIVRMHIERKGFDKNYKVKKLSREDYDKLSEEVKNMALRPLDVARRFQSYIIKGYRYRILEIDRLRKTQNSGVIMKATQMSYASRQDTNPLLGNLTFYGQLTDIIELQYLNNTKFVLFKCNWINDRGGKRVDKYKFTLVNFNHLLYKDNEVSDEPFILASQAEQAFYVPDAKDPNWQVVVQMTPRNNFGSYSSVEAELEIPQIDPFGTQQLDLNQRETWVRQEEEGELIDATICDEENIEG